MQHSLTFELAMMFDYCPAEWEQGCLFIPERMELTDSNLELPDSLRRHFEQMALQDFKVKQAEAKASRAYDLVME